MNVDAAQTTGTGKRSKSDGLGPEELVGLVRGAQSGRTSDFQKLYEAFIGKILNYLYRMTGSRDEAEDIAQDTFVLAYRKLDLLKDPAKFQSWIYRIAQNNVYQQYRGKKPRMESIDRDEAPLLSDVQKLESPHGDPEEQALSSEIQREIAKAIADLPEKYRTVFILAAIQQLSYREISEIVERSLASVKSDIHRARVTVRDRIKNYLGENHGMQHMP